MTVAGNLAFQSGALYLVQVNPSSASAPTSPPAAAPRSPAPCRRRSRRAATSRAATPSCPPPAGSAAPRSTALTTQPAGRLRREPELHRDRRDPEPHRRRWRAAQRHRYRRPEHQPAQRRHRARQLLQQRRRAAARLRAACSASPAAISPMRLSQLSGEAATGGQQAAFQLTDQFLGLMLDPFVDGRSGVARRRRPALGFAPEREAVPESRARLCRGAQGAAGARPPSFEQRWSAWGGAYGGSNRTVGDPAVIGSHDLSARTAGFAGGLDYRFDARHRGGRRARRRRHRLEPRATVSAAARATPSRPASTARRVRARPISRPRFAFTNHWMSTDRFAFAGDHLTASFNAQSIGGRVESGYRFATMFGGITPYAAMQAQSFRTPDLQRDRCQRRRLRAGLQRPHRDRHPQRARRPLRPPAGAQPQRGAGVACAARLGARLGERSGARGRVPDASGRELHRQRRDAGEELRAGLGRRRAAPRQRRLAASASSTASSRAAPPPMPAPGPSDIRGDRRGP